MSTLQEHITELNWLRNNLLEKEENNTATLKELGEIEILTKDIINKIEQDFDLLPFDFILEQLSKLGHCPCLINDDNGHWAISGEGMQNVVYGDEMQDVESHFYIEAEMFQNTIKEALIHYLNEITQ